MKQKLEKWWKRLIAVGLVISLLSIWICDLSQTTKNCFTFGMFAGNKWDVPDDNCYQMIDQVIKEILKKNIRMSRIKYESGVMKDDYSEWLSQKGTKRRSARCFYGLVQKILALFSSVGC
mgnify:CR=1 FL=1